MVDRTKFEERVKSDLLVFAAIIGGRPEQLVAMLGPYQSGRSPRNRDTWYAWLEKPAQLSSVAYLKVVDVIRAHNEAAEQQRPPTDPALAARGERVTRVPAPRPRATGS